MTAPTVPPTTDRHRQRFYDLHQRRTFILPNAWDAGSARILAALGAPAIGTTSAGHAASLGRADQHRTFILPNAWDAGSARILAALGAPAIGTTSAGHAASLGRADQHVTLDELIAHATSLTAAIDVPVSIDAERCFADTPAGVTATIERLAATGAAGVSIEDYDPATGIDPIDQATERVAAAADAAHAHGMVLTARADAHLYGPADLDDTIRRLRAYHDAGADCLYAPGLIDLTDITTVVDQVDAPVNVLALPASPSIDQLTDAGVRRISTGPTLTYTAYAALEQASRELLAHRRVPAPSLTDAIKATAFSRVPEPPRS